MRKINKLMTLGAIGALTLGGLAACSAEDSSSADGKGSVYYLNFKPESEAAWKKVAEAYTKETGVPVKIVTAASGTYETTLKTELAKSDGPTLFNVNGPIGFNTWKSYIRDVTDTDYVKALSDPDLALSEDGKVYSVPFATEGYGLIYNQAIMDKYFALPGAKATSMAEINSFNKLKEVTDDMQAKKADLGIDGVFASTSLAPGEDWRWQTHLANLPIFYEFRDEKVDDATELKLTYGENFKNIFDLYLTNSTIDPKVATSKTVSDSMAEFALGKAAMVQNGNWAWSQIAKVSGNVVKESDIHFLPIYTGVDGEEKQGINIGTENFMSVNAKAPEASQQASIDFLNWLFTGKGESFVTDDLGFMAPFKDFAGKAPADPLGKEVIKYINDPELYNVKWVFTVFPSQDFKDGLGQHLAQYAAGNEKWDDVTEYWKSEWAAQKSAQ